jgi:YHS domain-containing protein
MRILTLCLVAFVSFALLGCGESESKPATPPMPAKPMPSAKPIMPAAPATQPSDDAATQAAETAPPTNTKCPVTGEAVDPTDRKLTIVDYKGKAYGLCCKDCVDEFTKHPEKYVKAP